MSALAGQGALLTLQFTQPPSPGDCANSLVTAGATVAALIDGSRVTQYRPMDSRLTAAMPLERVSSGTLPVVLVFTNP